jgi:hypothetical protein
MMMTLNIRFLLIIWIGIDRPERACASRAGVIGFIANASATFSGRLCGFQLHDLLLTHLNGMA